ncbi:hypothetical protein C2G38_2224561 [Gigaspora rosea]|uniref:Uncharacterized protein n=1 Tax=Gigaspora rosea TaxID=44941 RepID=A0A397U396_9GLOM|nr:hypothetical protein C2G38_2224561 [Gigaspora rosea]
MCSGRGRLADIVQCPSIRLVNNRIRSTKFAGHWTMSIDNVQMQRLIFLNLQDNEIGSEREKALVEALRMTHADFLNLYGNNLELEIGEILAAT